jgi:hypothetical protein
MASHNFGRTYWWWQRFVGGGQRGYERDSPQKFVQIPVGEFRLNISSGQVDFWSCSLLDYIRRHTHYPRCAIRIADDIFGSCRLRLARSCCRQ